MSKGTPRRSVRIPDDVWSEALTTADEYGDKLSDVMREALIRYIEEKKAK